MRAVSCPLRRALDRRDACLHRLLLSLRMITHSDTTDASYHHDISGGSSWLLVTLVRKQEAVVTWMRSEPVEF